jgi:4-carboxymuconolactone decarboxylase
MPPIDRKKIHDAKVDDAHKTLFDTGLEIRRSVAGDSYVDASLARHSTSFSKPLQELVTEVGWGWIWTRPGLSRKQRSLLNLGMLCALNRSTELGVHVRGALRNGLSEEEIREALLQVGVYVGLPACKCFSTFNSTDMSIAIELRQKLTNIHCFTAIEGFRVAERALEDWKQEGSPKAKL